MKAHCCIYPFSDFVHLCVCVIPVHMISAHVEVREHLAVGSFDSVGLEN